MPIRIRNFCICHYLQCRYKYNAKYGDTGRLFFDASVPIIQKVKKASVFPKSKISELPGANLQR